MGKKSKGSKKSKKGKGSKKSKKSSKKSGTPREPVIEFSSGVGEFEFPNGDKYEGEYAAHRSGLVWREGHGIYTTMDGQIYEGDWKDDKLIENKPLTIRYKSGAEFNGKILKNKYNGAGSYLLENKLTLLCDFKDNKPKGELIFLNEEEKCCYGEAGGNGALFFRENIFYANLDKERGKGRSKFKPKEPEKSTSNISSSKQEVDDAYWRDVEKAIFAKSTKTPSDLRVSECPWYQNYLNFKIKRRNIFEKLKETGILSLDENEKKWYDGYMKFKQRRKLFLENKSKEPEIDPLLLENYLKETVCLETKCVPMAFIAETPPDTPEDDITEDPLPESKLNIETTQI